MSRLCPGLPDFAALSRNPARLHKWRCGTSINSVHYRISVRISRCLMGVAIHNRPKVGVVIRKWAWSINFRARFARVNSILYVVPVSSHKLGNYDLLSLKILFVYFLALPSLLRPSILFNCFLYLFPFLFYCMNATIHIQ